MAGTYTKEKGIENMLYNGDLESEDAIMNDKERFGRVRTILMKQLRAKYGMILQIEHFIGLTKEFLKILLE